MGPLVQSHMSKHLFDTKVGNLGWLVAEKLLFLEVPPLIFQLFSLISNVFIYTDEYANKFNSMLDHW